MTASDRFALHRFVEAQAQCWPRPLDELRAGKKRSHWMWFVFPQIAGLGRSPTAIFYAIGSAAEARAYLAHPLLGPRLLECATALLGHQGEAVDAVLGPVDAVKLRSSMTLFEAVAADPAPFAAILDASHSGARDSATLRRLAGG
jgi:uncharacterized protein (DUF1810 family)